MSASNPAPRRSDDDREAKPNAPRDNKLVFAEEHLKDERWLVKGYTDKEGWALGVKSTPHGLDELDDICTTTAQIVNEWLAVESQEPTDASPATAPSA